jgi:nitroreductase
MSRYDDLWRERYGAASTPTACPMGSALPVMEQMLAHRTVRAYLPDPVPQDALQCIVAAAQSAATSSNLQTWSVVAVRDRERKARLAECAANQAHIHEAPLLLIWLADLSRSDRNAQRAGSASEANRYTEMFLVSAFDAVLAAQNATLAAEALGYGTSYIGAMRNHPAKVSAELKLPKRVFPIFGLTVGRPDPARLSGVKPRLPQNMVLFEETYDAPAQAETQAVAAYDEVMLDFQKAQGMKPMPWSTQSAQRVAGAQSLSGRDRLVSEIHAQGFELK